MNIMNTNKASLKKAVSVGIALIIVFFLGVQIGGRGLGGSIKHPNVAVETITDKDFAPFWKVWKTLDQKYVAATSTTQQDKIWGAIKGLAGSTGDPYTVFFPPVEAKAFENDIAGNFEGVGMEIGLKEDVLTVIAPLKGSPAEKAGMQTGDKVVKIDEKSTQGLTVDQAIKLIRGSKGTPVTLTVIRDGVAMPLEKKIIRDVIAIPTLETEIKDGVFVLRLFSFTADSPSLFQTALRKFYQSGTKKLIVDLRGNPGGYLEAAWDMSSWFLPAGKVVVTEDFGGKQEDVVYRSRGYNVFGKDKGDSIIILVNGGSASASEIFAGALREHGVAQLVGTKTFGKGSVQELIKITPETSLKVTVARWLTPNGHNLSANGLIPDVEVKITPKDIESKLDPQLNMAIEILNKQK